MKLQKIKKILINTRKDFEKNNINKSILIKYYLYYNSINNINKFIKKTSEIFPRLNCELTSIYSKCKIKKSRLIKGKYKNNDHTFLTVNEIIIDITADQFNGIKIYIGNIKSPWSIK